MGEVGAGEEAVAEVEDNTSTTTDLPDSGKRNSQTKRGTLSEEIRGLFGLMK